MIQQKITGNCLVYKSNNIDTDVIFPAKYLHITDIEEMAKHAFEDLDPDFIDKVKRGDIIVAGNNFGCGSSREHAPLSIKAAGVSAIVAESFSRIFYRNAINSALPIFECSGITHYVDNGDKIEINTETGEIYNNEQGQIIYCKPISGIAKEIVSEGGLLELLKSKRSELTKGY